MLFLKEKLRQVKMSLNALLKHRTSRCLRKKNLKWKLSCNKHFIFNNLRHKETVNTEEQMYYVLLRSILFIIPKTNKSFVKFFCLKNFNKNVLHFQFFKIYQFTFKSFYRKLNFQESIKLFLQC